MRAAGVSKTAVWRWQARFMEGMVIEKLKAQLAVLKRARFGRSSEKLDHQIEQLELMLGDLEEAKAERQERVALAAAPARHAPIRRPLPEHLPREVVRHEPPAACPECGGTAVSKLGEESREVLEYAASTPSTRPIRRPRRRA